MECFWIRVTTTLAPTTTVEGGVGKGGFGDLESKKQVTINTQINYEREKFKEKNTKQSVKTHATKSFRLYCA